MSNWYEKYPEVGTGTAVAAPAPQAAAQPAARPEAQAPAGPAATSNWREKYPEARSSQPAAAAPASAPAQLDARATPAAGGNWWEKFPEVGARQAQAPSTVEPPASAPPERSVGESIGRQVGLTARHAINGAAALPALAADAVTGVVNSGLDKVMGDGQGFRFQSSAKALDDTLTNIGLPTPETAQERVVGDATAALAGVGGTVALGQTLARAAGPLSQAAGEFLTANSGMQAASAVTGAGAAGLTREAGGGAGAQLAAGLAGAVLPGLATAPFRRVATEEGRQAANAARNAHEAGYVIPPADLSPGPVTELASAISGKVKTAQEASARNQTVTNDLVRKDLGLTPGQDLNTETLAGIRREAAQSYSAVAGAGTVTPTAKYAAALDDAVSTFTSQAKSFPGMKSPAVVEHIEALRSPQFDAGDAMNTIKVLRSSADAAYRSGDNLVGKAYKKGAAALEGALEDHLAAMGAPADEVLQSFRQARQAIARTYTVEKALNSQTGNVNAQKLAFELARGKPLSGDMKRVAEAAHAFPRATQALKEAPQKSSVLDATLAMGATATTGNPLYAATVVARPVVRSVLLSKMMQARAVGKAGTRMQAMPDGAGAIALGAGARAAADAGEGKPEKVFKNRLQAGSAARQVGGKVVPVDGGFVVRAK